MQYCKTIDPHAHDGHAGSQAAPPRALPGPGRDRQYETLGDHWAAAEQYALAATARPADTYVHIVSLDLVAGAEMHLKRGNIEQACATWHRAIDHMGGVRSARIRKAVSRMRGDLARFRAPGLLCVAELDERGRDFLARV
ncbi:hypothetical protein ACIQ7Q_20025 [Streptomyces sp. NPDC096176]|uniref:hypothetical protein n=1 Tax=Streptomyces sp. NPDC096176 TaxID=3366079 RepID=UPI0037F41A2F